MSTRSFPTCSVSFRRQDRHDTKEHRKESHDA